MLLGPRRLPVTASSSVADLGAPASTAAPGRWESEADRTRLAWYVLAVFLLVVGFGATQHEVWRDEVRALSIATDGRWFTSIFANLTDEGHPALWYLLLRAVSALSGGSPLALPVTSALVAAGAVWLLVRYAPFPAWQRVLFAFGVFPLYEYSVSARNYGISMLLLIAFCAVGAGRWARPVMTGLILALLANTNVHSLVLVGALLGVWLLERWRQDAGHADEARASWPHTLLGVGIAVAGMLVCVVQTRPTPDSVVAKPFPALAELVPRAWELLLNPGAFFAVGFFGDFAGMSVPWLDVPARVVLTNAVLLAIALVLTRRVPLLLAFTAVVGGLTLLFGLVYPPAPRHMGLLYVFVIGLFWLYNERRARDAALAFAAESSPGRGRWRDAAANGLLGGLLIVQVGMAWQAHRLDHGASLSSAREFAAWLRATPRYHEAVIMAEPDFLLETLPYYLPNRLWIAREGRFGRWTRFTRANRRRMSLGELLADAQAVRARTGAPVLLLLARIPMPTKDGALERRPFGQEFTWTAAEVSALQAHTTGQINASGSLRDENYFVLEVLSASTPTARVVP
jgi:hypothetical protein